MTPFLKPFSLAILTLSLAACTSSSESSTAVENEIEAAANRTTEALESASDMLANATNDAQHYLSYTYDEAKVKLTDQNRDLFGDLMEAGGYINQRLDEISVELTQATGDEVADLEQERNALRIAGQRISDDLNNFENKVKEDFKTFEASTRAYINELDLDIDLDDDQRDYKLN